MYGGKGEVLGLGVGGRRQKEDVVVRQCLVPDRGVVAASTCRSLPVASLNSSDDVTHETNLPKVHVHEVP